MAKPPPIRAVIELEPRTAFPRGELRPEGEAARPFSGWLEFAAAIEAWRAVSHDSPKRGREPGGADEGG
jgi:hypothetical protein